MRGVAARLSGIVRRARFSPRLGWHPTCRRGDHVLIVHVLEKWSVYERAHVVVVSSAFRIVAVYAVRDDGFHTIVLILWRRSLLRVQTSGAGYITASAKFRAAWPLVLCCHRYRAWLVQSHSSRACPDQ